MIIKNPSEEQLKTLTHIIYLIWDNVNQKGYVGESHKTFYKRYVAGNWVKYSHSKLLKTKAQEIGAHNFSITILEYNVLENRKRKETEYCNLYNTWSPFGYNILPGEAEHPPVSEEAKMNLSLSHAKPEGYWIKEGTTGNLVHFKCPREIVIKYAVKVSAVNKLIRKEVPYIKNIICLPEHPLYEVQDMHGNKFKFIRIRDFCKTHNISEKVMSEVLQGYIKTCGKQGFRLLTTPISFKRGGLKPKYKSMTLEKDGVEYKINYGEITKFSKTHNIPKDFIYQLSDGRKESFNGFKSKNVELLNPSDNTFIL